MTQPVWITRFTAETVEAWAQRAPADGPLAGFPFAVKDNIDVAGHPTTAACPALADRPATDSATAVTRLVEAGAVPVGKTNMDQFATGLVGTRSPYGACHSVANPRYISGGSSSGSAVAVADGTVPLALGTDTAGSGRIPAAFNGIVGFKPTRGLVSTHGVLPACRSLDCVTTFTRYVKSARTAFHALASPDRQDPYSRERPSRLAPRLAAQMRVVGVPSLPLDLDDPSRQAWLRTIEHARSIASHLVPIDVTPMLEAGKLLYQGPWIAQRWDAFGEHLQADGPHLDPVVRRIVLAGRDVSGADVFRGIDQLARLRQDADRLWADIDALLLPAAPFHPTFEQVAADPIEVNSRLGTYTNAVNLLDLCAIALPGSRREDGLPFGVQLIAPAFADDSLLDLASRWTGEKVRAEPEQPGTTLLAVVGAHLSGLPLNGQLLRGGATLEFRTRTGSGYRLYRLPGTGVARPGLVDTGDGPASGIAVEVWRISHEALGTLVDSVPPPLGFGKVALADGSRVLGFVATDRRHLGEDVSSSGGWRSYLDTFTEPVSAVR